MNNSLNPLGRIGAIIACGVLIIWMLTAGCAKQEHRMVEFLIDETASAEKTWESAKNKMADTVRGLKPGERFLALAIDDKAGDAAEVRLDETLPRNPLLANRAKVQLIQQIKDLIPQETSSLTPGKNGKPRGTPQGTDTLGAISYAARLSRQANGKQVLLCICSDFADEPRTDTLGGDTFPPSSRFVGLFVGTREDRGLGEVDRRIARWAQLLKGMSLTVSESDFHTTAESGAINILKL